MGDDNWARLPKFMSPDVLEAMCIAFSEIAISQSRKFSIVLHGGEPFLLGPLRLEALLARLRAVLSNEYPISIQTNGILITKEILDICSFYSASVAVSLDGPRLVNDRLRLGHDQKGTFDSVMNGLHELNLHSDSKFLNAGLLAVIDPESEPSEIYEFFKSIQAPSVDFLFKDGNHDRLPDGKSSADSNEYGKWMTKLLDHYLKDSSPVPIRVLDDMLKVLLGGMVTKEGLGVTDFGIIIIDTDGTVMKNDTLKSSYNGADKFKNFVNVKDGNILQFINSAEFIRYRAMQRPANEKCLSCPDIDLCGGGMVLHRWSKSNQFNNPSIYCSDQKFLINNMRKTLNHIISANG